MFFNTKYGTAITLIEPNICPICQVVNRPIFKSNEYSKDENEEDSLITLWLCANNLCDKIFVAEYLVQNDNFKFKRFLNGLPKGPNFPKPILNLNNGNPEILDIPEPSKFIKTYLQSLQAEHLGLNEIAGMGYRKSIEYLVKDWAIHNFPDNKVEIISSWLSNVVKNYYSGELKEILERAVWLGNDQSHYLRLFEDFDIDIIKELIELILVELDREEKKKHYLESIQKRK